MFPQALSKVSLYFCTIYLEKRCQKIILKKRMSIKQKGWKHFWSFFQKKFFATYALLYGTGSVDQVNQSWYWMIFRFTHQLSMKTNIFHSLSKERTPRHSFRSKKRKFQSHPGSFTSPLQRYYILKSQLIGD